MSVSKTYPVDIGGPGTSGAISPHMPPTYQQRRKGSEDTVAGCRALAAADLTLAATMDTRNGRLKFERSAASWQERAELLQRLETSSAKRKALDAAEWHRADADERMNAGKADENG